MSRPKGSPNKTPEQRAAEKKSKVEKPKNPEPRGKLKDALEYLRNNSMGYTAHDLARDMEVSLDYARMLLSRLERKGFAAKQPVSFFPVQPKEQK